MASGWPVFFDHVRSSLFRGRLTQSQVTGLKALVQEGRKRALISPSIGYVAATSFHETGGRMQPVREGFARTNAAAVAAVTRLYKRGKIRKNYALADPETGQSYYGRGDVQLTWRFNYERMASLLGVDLVNNPDLALDNEISKRILFEGMIRGTFTGKRLDHYITENSVDFVGARRIVNGTDRDDLIAGYADKFLTALRAGLDAQEAAISKVDEVRADPAAPSPMIGAGAEIRLLTERITAIEGRQRGAAVALGE